MASISLSFGTPDRAGVLALGSTLALTDTGGTVKTDYTYEPFGKTSATGQTSNNTFKYTGREDDGTGLYYYRARYYHPGLQRFTREDPRLGFPGVGPHELGFCTTGPRVTWALQSALSTPEAIRSEFFNAYGYAENNPMARSTRAGRMPAVLPDYLHHH